MAASIASTSLLVSMLFLSGAIATPKFDFFSKFDFFYLVLTWPGAPCSKGNICCLSTTGAPELDFYVKDMHPYKYWWTIFGWTGQDVTDCNDTPFVADELENQTRLYMDKYWANIKCPCNNGLSNWEHVWSKFGTCSGLTQNEYFEKTLQLRSKLNLLIKLRKERKLFAMHPYRNSQKCSRMPSEI
ncbi:ribonuclease 3-like [Magnolia sinica]|uniref:ribonuclease 3-like n=1 Tax=Magnolia sinica TaxID=86752 RepID=UPI00265A4C2C|nr:ribonuclease 3-like [Magnolia sinica]